MILSQYPFPQRCSFLECALVWSWKFGTILLRVSPLGPLSVGFTWSFPARTLSDRVSLSASATLFVRRISEGRAYSSAVLAPTVLRVRTWRTFTRGAPLSKPAMDIPTAQPITDADSTAFVFHEIVQVLQVSRLSTRNFPSDSTEYWRSTVSLSRAIPLVARGDTNFFLLPKEAVPFAVKDTDHIAHCSSRGLLRDQLEAWVASASSPAESARNMPYSNILKEYYHGSKCWFKDVWKRHNRTGQDKFYSLEGKDEISIDYIQSVLCSGRATYGVLTEEEQRKHDQDETLCRRYILSTITDRLYDLYTPMTSAREIWNSLEEKYTAEKEETDKFITFKFSDFLMEDNVLILIE
ncbi:hypothetical protein Tco_0011083 [Tanacetum coccineum]